MTSYKMNATETLIDEHVNMKNVKSFDDLNITDRRQLIICALMDDYFDQAEFYLESSLDIHGILIQYYQGSFNEHDVGAKLIQRVNELLSSELTHDIDRHYDVTHELSQDDKRSDLEFEKKKSASTDVNYKDVLDDLSDLKD